MAGKNEEGLRKTETIYSSDSSTADKTQPPTCLRPSISGKKSRGVCFRHLLLLKKEGVAKKGKKERGGSPVTHWERTEQAPLSPPGD